MSSGVNVAVNGVATQSSTLNNLARFQPSKAIDGDNATFCHTHLSDSSAYWEVELEESVRVDEIRILNRYCGPNESDPNENDCLCRLSSATITLYDGMGAVAATRSLGNTCGELLVTETFSAPSTVSADKLRVEATTGEQIQMFEVQIYASGSNVAPQGSASQSSTWGNLAAINAIDSSNSTFSHTADSNAWWEVQLTDAVEVDELVILNRYCQGVADSPGCLCRLSNAVVTLYNNNVSVATRQLGNTCGEHVVSESFSSLTSPTSRPTPTSSFSYSFTNVGAGRCLDSYGSLYGHVGYSRATPF